MRAGRPYSLTAPVMSATEYSTKNEYMIAAGIEPNRAPAISDSTVIDLALDQLADHTHRNRLHLG